MWVFVIGMEMATSFTHAEYFTSLYPTTGFLVNVSLLPLSLFGTLALTWFAAEVSWRARAARMADILDATPASPWRFYLARLGALAMLIVVLIALTIVVGVVIQLARGYTVLELPLWLSLFPLAGLPLLLVAVLALLVQSLSPNRWVGLTVSLALLIGLNEARNLSALSHPILRYGATPALEWSDMNGYGAALGNWAWFMGAWALGGIASRWLPSVPGRAGARRWCSGCGGSRRRWAARDSWPWLARRHCSSRWPATRRYAG